MTDTAIILAAGLGARFQAETKTKPKGFISVFDKTLIERSLEALQKNGIKKIFIGTGYLSSFYEDLAKKMPQICCIKSDKFETTSSMYTLYNMKDHINSDFLLLESDLLYDCAWIELLQKSEHSDAILVSGKTNSGDEVYIETDDSFCLKTLSKNKDLLGRIDGELVGISKVSLEGLKWICDYYWSKFKEAPKMDYESALCAMSCSYKKVFCEKNTDLAWCEIDNIEHYKRAIDEIYPRIYS